MCETRTHTSRQSERRKAETGDLHEGNNFALEENETTLWRGGGACSCGSAVHTTGGARKIVEEKGEKDGTWQSS